MVHKQHIVILPLHDHIGVCYGTENVSVMKIVSPESFISFVRNNGGH